MVHAREPSLVTVGSATHPIQSARLGAGIGRAAGRCARDWNGGIRWEKERYEPNDAARPASEPGFRFPKQVVPSRPQYGAPVNKLMIFGYHEGDRLMYAARTRTGFTPLVREQLFRKFAGWNQGVPLRESSGSEERSMGCRLNSRKDDRLTLLHGKTQRAGGCPVLGRCIQP
jgi:hypothetical protein